MTQCKRAGRSHYARPHFGVEQPFNQVAQARRVGILPAQNLCSSIFMAGASVFLYIPPLKQGLTYFYFIMISKVKQLEKPLN